MTLSVRRCAPLHHRFGLLHKIPATGTTSMLFLPAKRLGTPLTLHALSRRLFHHRTRIILGDTNCTSNFCFAPHITSNSLILMGNTGDPRSDSAFRTLAKTMSLFIRVENVKLKPRYFTHHDRYNFLITQRALIATTRRHTSVGHGVRRTEGHALGTARPVCIAFASSAMHRMISFVSCGTGRLFGARLPALSTVRTAPRLVHAHPGTCLLSTPYARTMYGLQTLNMRVRRIAHMRGTGIRHCGMAHLCHTRGR